MNKSISESFQDFSRREHKELESKQKLTQLLDEQIDINEELRLENQTLVENQRKLLYLLDARDQIIARFQQSKPGDDNHNNSTFQQTKLFRDDRRIETSPQKHQIDGDQIGKERLQKIQAELEALKQTYEATKSANQSLQNRLDSLTGLIKQKDLQIDKAKKYNAEAYEQMEQQHQFDTRQMLRLKQKVYSLTVEVEKCKKELDSKDEQTHQKLINTQRQLQQRDVQLEGAKAELDELRRIKQKMKREIDSSNQELAYQRQSFNDRIEQLEETLADNLSKVKESYQTVNRYEQQIVNLKADVENKSYECSQLAERLDAAELRAKNVQDQSMRQNSMIEELKSAVNLIKKDLDTQIRNNNNLRKEIIELEKQAKAREEQPILENGKLEQLQLTIQQLEIKLDRSKEQTEKVNQKAQRQIQRRDKHISELKKIVRNVQIERDGNLAAIQQLQAKLLSMQEGYSNKQRRLKDQIVKIQQDSQRSRSQSRLLKKQLENMDGRVRSCLGNLEEKNTKIQGELYSANEQIRFLQNENEHLKKLYEKSEIQISDYKESMDAKQRQAQMLKRKISQMQSELKNANSHIVQLQNNTQAQEHVEKLSKQLTDAKARIQSATESRQKLKNQNAQLVKQTISLNEHKASITNELEKYKAEIKSFKLEKVNYENKISQIQRTLQEKTTQLDKSSPYLSQLIQEKKLLELQVTKMSNQIKTYHHLLEVAKKTKADQIIALNKDVATMKKSQSRWEAEIKQANKTIENHNREKVNMLRQNTVREDKFIKLEKDNKILVQQIKNLQKIIQDYQNHLEITYKILHNTTTKVQQYEANGRDKDNKSAADLQGSRVDLSPIRSSSNRTFVAPSDPPPRVATSSLFSNPRSSIQRIQSYKQAMGIQ